MEETTNKRLHSELLEFYHILTSLQTFSFQKIKVIH